MNKVPMTARGVTRLQEELQELKSVLRPKIIAAIAEARAHGDLKENAEYAAAREQQSFVEGRIKEIEYKVSNAQIIDISDIPCSGKVIFGATVTLLNCDTEEEVCYQIVGEDEADVKAQRISITSPIARGLIGKLEGDVVDIQTPGGIKSWEIVSVEHI